MTAGKPGEIPHHMMKSTRPTGARRKNKQNCGPSYKHKKTKLCHLLDSVRGHSTRSILMTPPVVNLRTSRGPPDARPILSKSRRAGVCCRATLWRRCDGANLCGPCLPKRPHAGMMRRHTAVREAHASCRSNGRPPENQVRAQAPETRIGAIGQPERASQQRGWREGTIRPPQAFGHAPELRDSTTCILGSSHIEST